MNRYELTGHLMDGDFPGPKLSLLSSVKDAASCFVVLDGPQGPQRRLLRLGQAPRSSDIEPLIRPIMTQRPQQLGALEVPYLDGIVIAATGQ